MSSSFNSSSEEVNIEEPSSSRDWWRWFITILAIAFVLYHLLYISDFLVLYTNLIVSRHEHVALHLSGILFFTFLILRARKETKGRKPPPYDIFLAIISLGIPLYHGLFYEQILENVGSGMLTYAILGWLLSLLLIEAARRAVGTVYAIIVAFFLIYPVISNFFPGFLYAPAASFILQGEYVWAAGHGIFGFTLSISAIIVVMFLLFAQLLMVSGAGEFFINIAYAIMGMVRGGPAKMAIVASAFFGTLSGAAVGNAAATGSITIPLMKKTGYPAYYAGAVEAVASSGGALMPPVMGSVIFLLVSLTGIPYFKVIGYAAIPAVLFYAALFIMVDQEAVRLNLRGLPRDTLPSLWRTLKQGFWYAIPIIVLVYLLAGQLYTPQKACLWSMITLVVLSSFHKETRLGKNKALTAAEQTVRMMLQVGIALSCAGIIISGMTVTGVGVNLAREIVNMSGGSLIVILVMAAVVSLILGMGTGPTGCYIFLALMVAPAIIETGVPVIAAHLFVFYFALVSFITPPVATVAYVTAGIAGANAWKTGWQAFRLGLLAYVLPFAFVFKPALLAGDLGTPLEIAMVVIFAVIGTMGLSFASGGHFMGKLNWAQRIMCGVGSMALIFGQSAIIMGSGAFILVIALSWQWQKSRLTQPRESA